MIYITILVLSYPAVGLIIYSEAVKSPMPKRDQIKYSVFWPWLFIATFGCFLWDYITSED